MKIVPIKEKEVSIYGPSGCNIITHFIYTNEKDERINNMVENVIVSMTENTFLKIMNTSKENPVQFLEFIDSFSHTGTCSNNRLSTRVRVCFETQKDFSARNMNYPLENLLEMKVEQIEFPELLVGDARFRADQQMNFDTKNKFIVEPITIKAEQNIYIGGHYNLLLKYIIIGNPRFKYLPHEIVDVLQHETLHHILNEFIDIHASVAFDNLRGDKIYSSFQNFELKSFLYTIESKIIHFFNRPRIRFLNIYLDISDAFAFTNSVMLWTAILLIL